MKFQNDAQTCTQNLNSAVLSQQDSKHKATYTSITLWKTVKRISTVQNSCPTSLPQCQNTENIRSYKTTLRTSFQVIHIKDKTRLPLSTSQMMETIKSQPRKRNGDLWSRLVGTRLRPATTRFLIYRKPTRSPLSMSSRQTLHRQGKTRTSLLSLRMRGFRLVWFTIRNN
jgi:hypothetical protein